MSDKKFLHARLDGKVLLDGLKSSGGKYFHSITVPEYCTVVSYLYFP